MIARDSIRVEGQRAGALILEVEYVEMPQFAMASGDTDEDDGVGSGVPLDAVGGVDDTTTDGGGGMVRGRIAFGKKFFKNLKEWILKLIRKKKQYSQFDDGIFWIFQQLSQLERHAADLESECAALNDQMEVLQRRLEVLDGVAKQVSSQQERTDKQIQANLISNN